MKLKKRLLSLAVCFVLLLSVVPTVTTIAATPIPYANVTGFQPPVVGQTVADNLKTLQVPSGANYSIIETRWYDCANDLLLLETAKFAEGHEYYLFVSLAPKGGFTFDGTTPTINGSQEYVDVAYCKKTSGGNYWLYSKNFTAVKPTVIKDLNLLGFQPPVVGQTVSDNLKNLSVPSGANYSLDTVRWRDNTADKYLADTDKFAEGHEYYLFVALAPRYSFTFEGVTPTINGSQEYVDVVYCKKTSGGNYWLYSINLTAAKPTVIKDLNLLGFRKPTPGQTAGDNLASLSVPSAAHYSISEVYWIDNAGGVRLKGSASFAAGHTYFLRVVLAPDFGYAFDLSETTPKFDGSQTNVDTMYCGVTATGMYTVYSNALLCTVPTKVSTVNVTGFKEPVAGQTVASNIASLKVPAGANYVITEAYWLDVVANKIVSGSDVFEAGRFYYLTVCLDPKDGYTLSGASALLNGSVKDVDTEYCGIRGGEYEVVSIDFRVQAGSGGKKGDVNGDGVLNAFDYQMVKAYVLGTFPGASSAQIAAMDVNGDGNVNAFDYQMIKAVVLGTYSFS